MFNVDRQSIAGGAFLQIASNLTATTYTDTAVTAGNSYTYRVDAVNSTGVASSLPTTVRGAAANSNPRCHGGQGRQ